MVREIPRQDEAHGLFLTRGKADLACQSRRAEFFRIPDTQAVLPPHRGKERNLLRPVCRERGQRAADATQNGRGKRVSDILVEKRVDLAVGIAYESDIDLAIDVINEALARMPGVLSEPAPRVAVASLDESSVKLLVRPWAKGADYWTVNANALKTIKEALDRAGVKIPYNQIEVHQAKA